MSAESDDFAKQMDAATKQVFDYISHAKVEVVGKAFEIIVQHSPVKTGAYRSEHVVADARGSNLYYQHPDRSGPTADIPYFGDVVIGPPDVREARDSVIATGLKSIRIQNDRFYAGIIESGAYDSAPHGVYQVAADAVENFPIDLPELKIA